MTVKINKTPIIESAFLPVCSFSSQDLKAGPVTLVIFGGAGDLSRKKLLPALYDLFQKKLITHFSVLAIGRTTMTDNQYRIVIKKAFKEVYGKNFKVCVWNGFCKKLTYLAGDVSQELLYQKLCEFVSGSFARNKSRNLLFYLAVPPNIAPQIILNLDEKKLCRQHQEAKIVLEKPFGSDKKSASRLNKAILKSFDERQVYRIDHYLGKETVQNLLFFRFGNSIFEALWSREYIDDVRITVSEELGVGSRAAFYEDAGVLRDIVQNHIMQLITLVAMEPPVGFEANLIRDEKVKVLRSIRPMDINYIYNNSSVGQYGASKTGRHKIVAYRQEKNVAKNSKTATYFAGKFYIDNWRWAGVPFYVRTGKRLTKRITEIIIHFKNLPLKLIGRSCDDSLANSLIFTIQPQETIVLNFSVKIPGTLNIPQPVSMIFDYENAFQRQKLSAYERLLLDCLKGDQTLFARQDEIEEMWSVVDPIIKAWDKTNTIAIYPAASWGPKEAEE